MKINTRHITNAHTALTAAWHRDSPAVVTPPDYSMFQHLVEQNHLRNFLIWHEEDEARRHDIPDADIVKLKRSIDKLNQERNDFIERIDDYLVGELNPSTVGVPMNSETPGMIIDRLSILTLKEYHMREESERDSATREHRKICTLKLTQLIRQWDRLHECLNEFLSEVEEGKRTFAVYRQHKMYNDKDLNPQLYAPNQVGG